MLDQLVLKYARVKRSVINWVMQFPEVQAELKRQEAYMRNYLADQHAQAVRRERDQLAALIRPLIRVRASHHFNTCDLSYTVSISDYLLYNSRNDRKAMIGYLAEQIAHELMNVQPVSHQGVAPSYRTH
jgi:hypothetical protein